MPSTRVSTNIREFLKFGIVGGSGTLVNFFVVWVLHRFTSLDQDQVVANLFGTPFNIRWYHVMITIAFLVANTWNYQLNRFWTFKDKTVGWFRGYWKFLLTGIGALVVSQVVATLLMNPTSPIALPPHIFDDTTGFRTRVYWANAISVLAAMPINFIINKLWTFRNKSLTVVHSADPQ